MKTVFWMFCALLPVIPNKDDRATDSCFALVGAHQCGILLEVMDGKQLCVALPSLFGMTGEATTGSRLNGTESPSPSLLNTVDSEAGWFGVIFPVSSQTITPLGCDTLQSSAQSIAPVCRL